jgi:thiosulfate/3-mercaptopyruvate sulfurtransferase
MTSHPDDPTVSTEWLADHLDDPDVIIVDATWFMPGTPRDARAEHAERHIPGAVFFDIDEISDHSNPLPHMVAEPADFAVHARRLGVEPDSKVVVYDAQGLYSAARVWWNFRLMGHEAVFVLDGGLPKWIAEAHPLEAGWPLREHGEFKSHFNPALVRDLAQMRANVDAKAQQVVDARSAERFTAQAREPREGLRSGHIPGSHSLPSQTLVTAGGELANKASLQKLFKGAGVDLKAPIVTSCGSGVSAAILALALARLGRWDVAVYDGSWTEWGGLKDTPVAAGPA